MSLNDYHASAMDWRAGLKQNQRRTRLVILIYLILYAGVGFIVDVLMVMTNYQGITASVALHALLTFKIFPIATCTLFVIAGLSLLIAFSFHNRLMLLGTEYHEIKPDANNDLKEQQLYHVVEEMKVAAGLKFIPKVYIIEADYMNAFASGFSEKSAMVAITRGLIEKLDRAELQAVMAHELSHIRHLDIKLTLAIAILSNIMLMVIDVLFYSVIYGRRSKNEDNRFIFFIIMLRYLLPILTVCLSLFLSRTREFMADAGAVELMRDNAPLARALLKISQDHVEHEKDYAVAYGKTPHEQVRHAAYIFDPSEIDPMKSFTNLFSTHPSVEDRLKAMGFKKPA